MNSLAQPKTLRPLLALLAAVIAAFITPPTHAQNSLGTLTTLHAFSGTDGSSPYGGLLRLSDGSLYGVTESYPQVNNVYQGGSIYKIAPDGRFATVHVLTQAEGIDSESSLVQANDGYIYGSGRLAPTPYGATAFRLNPDGTVTPIHSFLNEASSIIGRLFQGSDGELYGTATSGGPTNNGGTIFKLNLDGTGTTVLHEFTAMDGYGPEGGVIQATDGNFYGTSPDGGGTSPTGSGPTGFSGGIFRYGPLGFEVVHRFDYTDGSYALAAPFQATDGNLYGTTDLGGPTGNGAYGNGTIYRYNISDGTFAVLHTFNGSDGANPRGSLIQGLDGAIYGTTSTGGTGSNNHGTIFRLTLDGQLTTLHEFTDADGNDAASELTQAPDGTFYGTTSTGGNNEQGTVFQFVVNAPSPGVVQFDQSRYDVDENAGSVTVSVTRTGGFTGAVSVNYQTSDGGSNPAATAGTDYTATQGTLTWADGDVLPKTFTVPIIDAGNFDNVYREFYVALSSPVGATLGATSASTVRILENDPAPTTPPVITSALMANGVDGQFFYYTITASNPGNGSGNYNATGLPPGLTVDNDFGIISGYPSQTGVYPVPISVTNDYGTTTATLTITITAMGGTGSGSTDLTLSVVDSPDPVIVGGTVTYTFTFGNKGPDNATGVVLQIIKDSKMTFVPNPFGNNPSVTGNVLTFGLPDLASGASGTVAFNFTADSTGTLTVGATISGAQNDPVASNSGLLETTLVVAQGTALAPQITSAASADATVGVPFTYQITAANGPTSFYATNLPAGLAVDAATGLISGTPTLSETNGVTLSAYNASGTGTAQLTIIVAPAGGAVQPTIAITSPPANIAVAVGAPVTLAASVTDPDAQLARVQFSVNGVVVATAKGTGPFTAAAAAPFAGTFVLAAVATDKQGRTSSSTVTITAFAPDADNPAPISNLLTPLDGRDILAGSTLTLVASADTTLAAGLDHVSINVDGVNVATFDADGNLLASTQGQPVPRPAVHRTDAGTTPLSKIFSTPYVMPGTDKLVNMIVVATDKLQHTTVSPVTSFHSRVTADRAPKVVFNNLSSLAKVSAGAMNSANVSATDPDTGGANSADGTLSQLEFWINGVNLAKTTNATSSFDFTTPTAGKYVLHGVATDGSGLTTVSDPVIVEADRVVPLVTVSALAGGQTVEGGAAGKIKVSRTGDTGTDLIVHYKLAGAAKGGVDYKTPGGSVTIPAGATQAKIKIKPIDNTTVDGTRVVKLKLKPATDGSYSLGTATTAKIKIIDND